MNKFFTVITLLFLTNKTQKQRSGESVFVTHLSEVH